MKAAQRVSGAPYVVMSVAATETNRLSYFEMRTKRRRVVPGMFAVALPQAA